MMLNKIAFPIDQKYKRLDIILSTLLITNHISNAG